MQGVAEASAEELLQVETIADITQQQVRGWFALPSNMDICNELVRIWDLPQHAAPQTGSSTFEDTPAGAMADANPATEFQLGDVVLRSGDVIAVTGSFDGFNRSDIKDWCACHPRACKLRARTHCEVPGHPA